MLLPANALAFFFQPEDGIRDGHVTGVQTCALPIFTSASGAMLHDADGREFVDLVGSWGPMILGHANEQVVEAVQEAAGRGLSFGAPQPGEVSLVEEVVRRVRPLEQVRLVNSGTEATMSALRVARAARGRDVIEIGRAHV